ncbi:MAG: hypothetical protein QXP88_03545 [Thermoproteota archaeon]
MQKIFIRLVNYSYSIFDKLKSRKNLYKILGTIAIPLSVVRLEFLKHINSLRIFSGNSLNKLFYNYKEYLNFSEYPVDLNSSFLYPDLKNLLQKSFDLSVDLESSMELKFLSSTTKKGIVDTYKKLVVMGVCFLYLKDKDVCTNLESGLVVDILDIDQTFSSDGLYFFLPASTYDIFLYIRATKEKENFNVLIKTKEYNDLMKVLEDKFIFYKFRGRVES